MEMNIGLVDWGEYSDYSVGVVRFPSLDVANAFITSYNQDGKRLELRAYGAMQYLAEAPVKLSEFIAGLPGYGRLKETMEADIPPVLWPFYREAITLKLAVATKDIQHRMEVRQKHTAMEQERSGHIKGRMEHYYSHHRGMMGRCVEELRDLRACLKSFDKRNPLK